MITKELKEKLDKIAMEVNGGYGSGKLETRGKCHCIHGVACVLDGKPFNYLIDRQNRLDDPTLTELERQKEIDSISPTQIILCDAGLTYNVNDSIIGSVTEYRSIIDPNEYWNLIKKSGVVQLEF